ncbi:MAG: hypothetical protein GYA36_19200 [Veillonellaceae bacterium]|nr:hypothetical protein [Veillonellaceae bacterium]
MPFSDQSPYTQYVQRGLIDGQFVAGNFVTLCVGPPRLTSLGASALGPTTTSLDDLIFPVGVIQNFNLGQSRTFNRIFEIGSDRSYFISGRTFGQIGLSRVHYYGPSLLRLLYAYYRNVLPPEEVDWLWPNLGAQRMANPHDVIVSPGYENLFLNLASDLFGQPVGLGFFVRDSNMQSLGAFYCEACVIPNHTWATDAMGVIIQESVGIQYERLIPIKIRVVPLVKGDATSNISAGPPAPVVI